MKERSKQVTTLISEKLEERNRQDIWFGWVLTFLSIVVTAAGIIIGFRFKQHLNLSKELRQIRTDITKLQNWCRSLERQLNTVRTVIIIFIFLYGFALGGIAIYLNLR